jgi:hypothetical protein
MVNQIPSSLNIELKFVIGEFHEFSFDEIFKGFDIEVIDHARFKVITRHAFSHLSHTSPIKTVERGPGH